MGVVHGTVLEEDLLMNVRWRDTQQRTCGPTTNACS